MNDEIYDDMALEQKAKQLFGVSLDIEQVVLRSVPVSPTAHATVFFTAKKQLFVYIDGQSRFLLKDVKTIVNRMGLSAEIYIPPHGNAKYFDEYGADRFKEVFPGMSHPTADDLVYYRTLAPYKPALVLIAEVKDSSIYKYDRDSKSGWRVATKFAYRRIKTI
jgi:hypothetical protein